MKNWQKKQLTRANRIYIKKKANAQKPPDISRKSAWCVPALDGSCLRILQEQEEGANLTQEVMGREGSVSGVGGGAYKLVRSKSLNFFPIKASALSTCCWVPEKQTKTINSKRPWMTQDCGLYRDSRTLYMADLKLLCVRQGWNIDLRTRALLQEAHVSPLFAD